MSEYKYKQVVVRFKWVDYCRIRHAFPRLYKEESASDYFRRLARHLQEVKDD